MANQKNFKTNINQVLQQYSKYTVSRVIGNKADDLLDMEVPADFSEALLENNIEINVYSLADNSLIFSDFIPNNSQANYLVADVMIRISPTEAWTNDLVSVQIYTDAGKVYVDLDVPAAEIGWQYRMIIVNENGSMFI